MRRTDWRFASGVNADVPLMRVKITLVLLGVFAGSMLLAAAQSGSALSYARDVEPIFLAECGDCHGAEKPKKGLDLSQGKGHAALVGRPSRRSPIRSWSRPETRRPRTCGPSCSTPPARARACRAPRSGRRGSRPNSSTSSSAGSGTAPSLDLPPDPGSGIRGPAFKPGPPGPHRPLVLPTRIDDDARDWVGGAGLGGGVVLAEGGGHGRGDLAQGDGLVGAALAERRG